MAFLEALMDKIWRKKPPAFSESEEYLERKRIEKEHYNDCVGVHENLPDIFHYWSDKYIRPKLEAFGFSSPDDFFRYYLEQRCLENINIHQQFLSIGSGNCDLESNIASILKSKGIQNFTITCLDLNEAMLQRGRDRAAEQNVAEHFEFRQGDFNNWKADKTYDAVIANQSLHHVLELEKLFEEIRKSLGPAGIFITSDMIGRNGHMRWPESLAIVEEYWKELPSKYKYNNQLKRQEDVFDNWDCSFESFEGIRAQDILPLLQQYFHFHLFIGFANIITPFVDRSFGHNFDANSESDRSFIDKLHERDEEEIQKGSLKPTHMLAVLANTPAPDGLKFHSPLTPEFCTRDPKKIH